jgi:hypothetical protein
MKGTKHANNNINTSQDSRELAQLMMNGAITPVM